MAMAQTLRGGQHGQHHPLPQRVRRRGRRLVGAQDLDCGDLVEMFVTRSASDRHVALRINRSLKAAFHRGQLNVEGFPLVGSSDPQPEGK